MRKSYYIVFIVCLLLTGKLTALPIVQSAPVTGELSLRDLSKNGDYISGIQNKKLTPAEYITDPLFLYAGLWMTLGWNALLREPALTLAGTAGSDSFADRVVLEPFAENRRDTVFSELRDSSGNEVLDQNGDPIMVPNGNFYAKNVVEPLMFTSFALYLRSKNYHPALYIAELFVLSALYEFTIRPFFMDSSFEQFLKNPAVGIIAGIALDELSSYLLTTPYRGLHVLAYFLNPFKLMPLHRTSSLLFLNPYTKAVSIELSLNF